MEGVKRWKFRFITQNLNNVRVGESDVHFAAVTANTRMHAGVSNYQRGTLPFYDTLH